jgi:hypothetical protein
MNTKPLVAALVIAGAGVGSYWYYSPYLSIKAMREAAQAKDADAFNDKVDYPKVRESLKGQMSALMAEKLGTPDTAGNGFAAFGALLGMAMVNQVVDAFVRPEMVMRSMQSGEFKPVPPLGKDSPTGEPEPKKVEWTLERKGTNKVIARAQELGQPAPNQDFGLVLERYGFADWKLTEIRLNTTK